MVLVVVLVVVSLKIIADLIWGALVRKDGT